MRNFANSCNIISYLIAIATFLIITGSCNTTNQMHTGKSGSAKLKDSILADTAGNKYSIKVLSDGKLWMTANLNLNIPDSYCYENSRENCEQFGRLYTWESARQGCKLLGEGWRLPTKDEFRLLTALYGGGAEDSNIIRKTAYKALLNGTAGFNAVLGGNRSPDSQYSRLGAHGFYWTVTESDNGTAWFANFGKGSQALYLQDGGEKTEAFSVRCVKSIDSLK